MSNITVVSDTSTGDELIYSTQAVGRILGVNDSTLRGYCSLMEKHRYEFQKNKNGHRIYYKKDIEMIKKIIDLKNSSSLTIKQAVGEVLGEVAYEPNGTGKRSSEKMDMNLLLHEFTAFKSEQMEFNKKLLEQLMKQEQYIKNSIEERDKKLMFAMKESMETRRQLAVAEAEREKERERDKKKKVWWQFWR
ncbi:MAG TPA: MerR family transcriptional regulator [Ureibacillus sp.]|nr:MerR family transcriptional regulator [Ureibacillus sp.]